MTRFVTDAGVEVPAVTEAQMRELDRIAVEETGPNLFQMSHLLASPRALAPLRVPRDTCTEYARSSRLEWLETNGTGGFAMGTVAGANTRRYHGHLVAALRPPAERHVLLAKVDEVALVDGVEVPLAVNQYPGALHPRGHERLVEFRLDPFPVWVREAGCARVEKSLFLAQGEQTVVIQWRASRPCRLRVHPLLAFRGFHDLAHANGALSGAVREQRTEGARRLTVRPYAGLPPLHLHHPGGPLAADGAWHREVEYLAELERGLDFREDLWRMGSLELELAPGAPAWLVATTSERAALDGEAVARLEAVERDRRRSRFEDPLLARLDLAAEQFLVRDAEGQPTVIAGYPWFADWGRDTMIALPGLLVARGRLDEARDVLERFLAWVDDGVIPNRFPDGPGEPEYNTADATLWLFQAVHAWLEAGGDPTFLRDEVYPAAAELLDAYRRGSRHGLRVDPRDGLLVAGDPGTQLTWMDARVGDRVATPRHGKPVEVNALYYNALRLMECWASRLGRGADAEAFGHAGDLVQGTFRAAFWNGERGWLNDVVRGDGVDDRLRPNQVIAVALPFPLVSASQRLAVVEAVERHLLTPLGLRTLAPGEPDYRGRYGGGPAERDGAYHQGTVWPWLLGPFARAYLAAHHHDDRAWERCRRLFAGLEDHLAEGVLGTLGEIFDGDAPHRPGGAPAQAWSVAEALHVLALELSDDVPRTSQRAWPAAVGTEAPR